ncbi:MAG: T9SS type A sorting domain-containing protein [Candidatus Kapabacteria bacterium]|nr:T9SS type A sorting domain-containing protein [Candidatus Kapabacteria bacterium]
MKKLDKLFEEMSKTEIPPFPLEDTYIRNRLTEIDKSNKFKFLNKKGILTMSIIAALIIIALNLTFMQKSENIKESSITADYSTSIEKKQSNSPQANLSTSDDLASVRTSDMLSSSNNSLTEKTDIRFHYYAEDTKSENIDSIDVLVLTDEELERINIKKVDCGYLFLTESIFPSYDPRKFKNISDFGYPKKGMVRLIHLVNDTGFSQVSILSNPDWDMTKSPGIFPEVLQIHKGNGANLSFFTTSFGTSLIKLPKIIANNTVIGGNLQSDLRQKLGPDGEANSIKVYFDATENRDLKGAIPICLRVKSSNTTGYIIVTYLATDNFIKMLPERYKRNHHNHLFNDLQDEIDLVKINNQFQSAVQEIGNVCAKSPANIESLQNKDVDEIQQIAGIEKLILTIEEAEKIGINRSGDILSCNFEDYVNKDNIPPGGLEMISEMFAYDTTKANILLKSKPYLIMFDPEPSGIVIEPEIYTGWDYEVWSEKAAVCITYQSVKYKDGEKLQAMFTHTSQSPLLKFDSAFGGYIELDNLIKMDSLGEYKPLYGNLIPVHFSWEEYEDGDTIKNQVDFWYHVSKKFAQLLPERYRTPILHELDIISQVEDGYLSPENACEALKGETSYLGICKLYNELFKSISLYPNPMTDNILHIRFALKANSRLRFELYNYDGKFIATLKDYEDYNIGNNQISLDISNTEQSIYLIKISDEKGNSAIEKLLKFK